MQKSIPQILKNVRQTIRNLKLSRKTENAYLNHIRRFLKFTNAKDISRLNKSEARFFLESLEQDACISVPMLEQARSALNFFYREVLRRSDTLSVNGNRSSSVNLPVILTAEEARMVLSNLYGETQLAAALMYGAGLRISETVRLRVRDLDFERGEIIVRKSCGIRDRTTLLPNALIAKLRKQLSNAEYVFEEDLMSSIVHICPPEKILRRYPNARKDWNWQFVFPAKKLRKNAEGKFCRNHLAESTVQKAVYEAVRLAEIGKTANCYALRHSFAMQMLGQNCDLNRLQTLLGHKNLKTTMIYTHFPSLNEKKIVSPLDV